MLDYDFEKLRQAFRKSDATALSILSKSLVGHIASKCLLDNSLYYHPLGFMYATLFRFSDKESIRLHIWNLEVYNLKPQLEIHTHYYRVNSFVYQGCIFNQLYEVDKDSKEPYSLYEGSYSKVGARRLNKTETVLHIALDRKEILNKGSLYRIEKDQIHSGGIEDGRIHAVTLVYTENPEKEGPLVFGRTDLATQFEYEEHNVSKDVLLQIYSQLEGTEGHTEI